MAVLGLKTVFLSELSRMEFFTIVVIAVGLAMDAFAVSIAAGGSYRNFKTGQLLRMAFAFGVFQALMPVFGWLAGSAVKDLIADFDHWVAFLILVSIGGKMIYESFKLDKASGGPDVGSLKVVFLLAVATSIDALAVGITLGLITSYVIWAAGIIGVVTFVLSYIGAVVGNRLGHFFESKIEVFGGLVLIGIGVKILLQHLLYAG